ncbi:MAG: hypothetical protein KC481_06125 [Acidimicrobiaceae bacterium]|nr:hypothetical protein [Acidimicrobiaceae bacterium]
MTVVLAVAVTAAVIGAVTTLVVSRIVRARINTAIGGRHGSDPVDEHQRILSHVERDTSAAAAEVNLLKLSLDALTSGVIVTDGSGKVLVRSRLAVDAATRSHEKTLVDATTVAVLAEAVQGRRAEREINVFGPPPRNLFVHAVPITADAQVIGSLTVIDDVTDHHRIEKTRRDFIANLSHELRTPVGAVSLLAEMLIDEQDLDTRTQLTDRMLIETDRMTEAIDDLLELSRIESSAEIYTDIVVVQDLIDEAVERTRVQAQSGDITIGAVVPDEPITLVGNRSQLATALVNLVENAVKYSSPGDSVSVRARLDDDGVALVVQDTGRGIPARDLDRIFERFYRVDRSRDAATGGTGIGLSIVRHVALNHGGHVSVASFEGDGSSFTLVLPVVPPGRAEPGQSPEPQTAHEVG